MTRLTGNRRYRKETELRSGWDCLVLQVEFYDWNGKAWRCRWRDATEDDIKPESII